MPIVGRIPIALISCVFLPLLCSAVCDGVVADGECLNDDASLMQVNTESSAQLELLRTALSNEAVLLMTLSNNELLRTISEDKSICADSDNEVFRKQFVAANESAQAFMKQAQSMAAHPQSMAQPMKIVPECDAKKTYTMFGTIRRDGMKECLVKGYKQDTALATCNVDRLIYQARHCTSCMANPRSKACLTCMVPNQEAYRVCAGSAIGTSEKCSKCFAKADIHFLQTCQESCLWKAPKLAPTAARCIQCGQVDCTNPENNVQQCLACGRDCLSVPKLDRTSARCQQCEQMDCSDPQTNLAQCTACVEDCVNPELVNLAECKTCSQTNFNKNIECSSVATLGH